MKSKLNYLISVSLKRKIKTKWFLVANVIICLVLVGLVNIDSIITFFGGDFNKTTKVYVIDKTEECTELFKSNISSILNMNDDHLNYEVVAYDQSEKEIKKLLKQEKEEDNIAVVFENSENLKVTMISEAYLDTLTFTEIREAIQSTKVSLSIKYSNIDPEEINKIYEPVTIERVYLDENKKSEDESMTMIMTTVFPIVILPFFMLIVFLVQMIGAEVNDEKTTRGMEIIISNVSPKTHFFSKIIAGNLFIFFQTILLISYSLLGIGIRKIIGGDAIMGGVIDEVITMANTALKTGLEDKLLYVLPLTIVLMIFTLLAYSLLAGILASMTTSAEDFQQVQTPIMIVSLVGYYLAMMAGVFDGALFIRILSYIPFISAILSPSLLILGQIGIMDILFSIALTLITIFFLIKYGLRIYKVGILNYSSSKMWSKMWKAMKQEKV